MYFDEKEFHDLVKALNDLAVELKKIDCIDKELALYLYSIPQIVRNAFLSFDGKEDNAGIANKLEDAWIELDALILDCLCGQS